MSVHRPAPHGLHLIGVYSISHALVDASCAVLVFSASAAGRIPVSLAMVAVLVYNLLAFASQPLLGWFVNDASSARIWARAGALVTAVAYGVGWLPTGIWPGVVLAGLGNAAFHVGGGVVSLRIAPGKATAPGLFVAPGAAGLAAGIAMGTHQWLAWLPSLALLFTIPFLAGLSAETNRPAHQSNIPAAALPLGAAGMLLTVIVMRAFVGSGLALPWKAEPVLLISLTTAVVLGKAAGGILADRFGRLTVGVGALCLAAPLLVIAPTWAMAGITGILLFNMTMPVTLVATADLLPERPGFAFGLTCLALILGSLPVALHLISAITPAAVALGGLLSAALLWLGLSKAGLGHAASPRPQIFEEV